MKRPLIALAVVAALSAAACVPSPPPGTFTVSRVIDGDTVDVGLADNVRLIGIDTPELDQPCGPDAAARMKQLVLNQTVALTSGKREDRDHYGRYLRYVNVGSLDAGRQLIIEGLADARYDSRDGYGAHPREADYVALDAAHPDRCG